MSDFKTSVDPGSRAYKDWLTTQRVDEVRKERGEELEKVAAGKNLDLLLFAGLLLHVNKIFNKVSMVAYPLPLLESPSGLIPYLASLKKSLDDLYKWDHSQNIDFVQRLTDSWNDLIHVLSNIKWAERKDAVVISAMSALMAAIGSYPLGEEHSLGFYLSRFAGEKWLPFPFIELLSSLHTNKKLLQEWICMIDALVSHLAI